MKKSVILITAILFLFSFVSLNAQNYSKATRVFDQGQADVQFGLGLTGTFVADKAAMVFIPLSLSVDYMLGKKFSIGVYGGLSKSEGRPVIFVDGVVGQWQNSYSEVGLRFGFHYTKIDNWDIYGGSTTAYVRNKVNPLQGEYSDLEKHLGIKPINDSFLLGAFVGAKYAVQEKVSVFSEVGIGATLFKIGIGYRIF